MIKIRNRMLSFALLVVSVTAGFALAQGDVEKKPGPEEMQIEGEVVDLVCYTAGGMRGEGHQTCAISCIEGGAPAGIVDQDDNVYVIIGSSHGYAPYAAQSIRLIGMVQEGRMSPSKMEVMKGKNWKEVKLRKGSPKG